MNERDQLEQAITALEGQRAQLGDSVVDASIAALREKLAVLNLTSQTEQQRKQVTILFADISGFTAMSETMDAEEVSDIMNALWQRLDAAIIGHGGLIDKHIGDAVMAIWGAGNAREDDPEQGIRAALAMQAALAIFREERQLQLAMRIGLNTGLALLGEVGVTAEFTAMGDAVNTASRLEHAAPVGGVLISHNTFQHVRGIFNVLAQDPLQVKGKVEPLQVYIVEGARPRAFRMGRRGVAGINTRMIGREAELKQLQAAYYTAMADAERQIITIIGEAGVGKSRLLYEFDAWLERLPEAVHFFKGRARQEALHRPYGLLRDMFAFRFEIHDSDSVQVVHEKLEAGIGDVLGTEKAGQMRAHIIGHLLGYNFSASPHLQGLLDDARQLHNQALICLQEFFQASTALAPTIIFLEDIHWADGSSLDMLTQLTAEHSLLIVCLARLSLFERRPNWGEGQAYHTRLELRPLSKRHSRRLVAEILQKATDIPEALRELVVSNAEGNPFYVEELIKMLIEDDVIVSGEERWHIEPTRLTTVRIPDTLTGILQARLDSLPPAERINLQRAAVVGRIFWDNAVNYLVLADNDRTTPATADEILKALRGREMIFQRQTSAFAGINEFIFKHAILREVTYQSTLKRMRRIYHGLVAEWLIEHSGERADEYTGLIANHLELAGQTAKALTYFQRAGEQAVANYANEEAIVYFSQGIALLKRLPDSAERIQQEISLQMALTAPLMMTKGYGAPEVEQAFTRTKELCEQIGDAPELFFVLHGIWNFYGARGQLTLAYELGQQQLHMAQSTQDPVFELVADLSVGIDHYFLGDLTSGLTYLEQGMARYDPQIHHFLARLFGHDHGVSGLNYESWSRWHLGYPDQALVKSQQAISLAQTLSHPHSLAWALVAASLVYQLRQEERMVQDLAEQTIQCSTEQGFPMWLALATVLRGWALAAQGQGEEGIAQIQEGLTGLQVIGIETFRPYLLALLAESYVQFGQVEQGLTVLAEALDIGRNNQEGWWEAELYRLRGVFLLIRGEREGEAERCYEQAIKLARQKEAKSQELRAAISLCRLWQQQGQREEAQKQLMEIYAWFTEGFETKDLQEAKALIEELSEGITT